MTTPNTERRAGYKEIDEKLEALVGLLTVHMTGEERDIAEIKDMLAEYFDKLDAQTHVVQHTYVGDKMKEEQDSDAEWKKLKSSLKEKAIIFVFGALMSWVGGVLWLDVTKRIQAPPDKPPAITQPVDKNVPNHP